MKIYASSKNTPSQKTNQNKSSRTPVHNPPIKKKGNDSGSTKEKPKK